MRDILPSGFRDDGYSSVLKSFIIEKALRG